MTHDAAFVSNDLSRVVDLLDFDSAIDSAFLRPVPFHLEDESELI